MNAVAKQPEIATSSEIAPQFGDVALMLERLAVNPAVDAGKLSDILDMTLKVRAVDAKQAFTVALVEMQPQLPVITENGEIKNNSGAVQSTYAEYEDINDAIQPFLTQYGFTLSFRPGLAGDKTTVTGVLSHRSGHSEEATITLPADGSGNKNGVQAIGSSLSYGKRYAVIALLNITSRHRRDKDDDGNGSGVAPAVAAASNAINICSTVDELKAWKAKNLGSLESLPSAQADAIVRTFNTRLRAVREGASQ